MRRAAVLPLAGLVTLLLALHAPSAAAQDVEPGAVDLDLTLGMSSRDAHVGDLVHFGFNVTNAGPSGATGVTVTLALPDDTEFVHGHRCGEASEDNVVTCSGEDLPPGASIGYAFSLRFREAGNATIRGAVESDQVDVDPTDNEDELTVQVKPSRPNPAPAGLSCVASAEGNRISWGVNDFVQEYRVYRATGDGEAVLVWSGVEQSFLDTDVEVGTTYRYEVAAQREQGESERAVCELTAIPEFPSIAIAAAAGIVALVGFVALRRRA